VFELKSLRAEAIPAALAKAERYRLLNEPEQAESICLDVLRTQPGLQQALTLLLLAITDGFRTARILDVSRARAVVQKLESDYERSYYEGIICERLARAKMERGGPLSPHEAYQGFREAMRWYAKAETLRPRDNDDAILRWNTCVRVLADNPQLQPLLPPEERGELGLE
jgi:hypothetical protein